MKQACYWDSKVHESKFCYLSFAGLLEECHKIVNNLTMAKEIEEKLTERTN